MALLQVGFVSGALGMCTSCEVILPQRQALAGGRLKVLWLLHGASDDHTIWQRRTSIERYVEPLGLAVVMPCAELSSYCDMAHGGRYFTHIADELPRIMADQLPLSTAREDNFIAGLSMGGMGSLQIGLARPRQYSAIGCLSAGMGGRIRDKSIAPTPQMEKRRLSVYGDEPIAQTYKDAEYSARQILEKGDPVPRVYHACGTEDFLLDKARATRDFFNAFPGNPFGYTYEEAPGAHTWEFWDEYIQHFLNWLAPNAATGAGN